MRIDYLWIGEYKNLKDITVNFDDDSWVTVVIGWNGTGKSNILEALATIFCDLITGRNDKNEVNRPSFPYRISYQCRWNLVQIDANPERKSNTYKIVVKSLLTPQQLKDISQGGSSSETKEYEEKSISFSSLLRQEEKYLPKYVFGYYSGLSKRMEDIFRKYSEKYDKTLRGGSDPGLKRLFYALPVHSQFVLLAFIFNQDNTVRKFLENELGLDPDEGIDSILFVLREPSWSSKKKKEEGDPRFWYAKGVVSAFLSRLYDVAIAPIRIKRTVQVSLWNKKKLEFLYLYVKDLASLRR